VIGPGDEALLEFDAPTAPALPEGWTRSYVLRAVGYCKDADPFTATSDSVGPLPWDGMPPFPFGPEGERPDDPAYRRHLREDQTRPAGLYSGTLTRRVREGDWAQSPRGRVGFVSLGAIGTFLRSRPWRSA
jgi:hypothetical protein